MRPCLRGCLLRSLKHDSDGEIGDKLFHDATYGIELSVQEPVPTPGSCDLRYRLQQRPTMELKCYAQKFIQAILLLGQGYHLDCREETSKMNREYEFAEAGNLNQNPVDGSGIEFLKKTCERLQFSHRNSQQQMSDSGGLIGGNTSETGEAVFASSRWRNQFRLRRLNI